MVEDNANVTVAINVALSNRYRMACFTFFFFSPYFDVLRESVMERKEL